MQNPSWLKVRNLQRRGGHGFAKGGMAESLWGKELAGAVLGCSARVALRRFAKSVIA
jgi:hypothetical protein